MEIYKLTVQKGTEQYRSQGERSGFLSLLLTASPTCLGEDVLIS